MNPPCHLLAVKLLTSEGEEQQTANERPRATAKDVRIVRGDWLAEQHHRPERQNGAHGSECRYGPEQAILESNHK
ncbi:MAG TPA: hypothetical protein VN673_12725 [Clostridia bacterium]|nr:hypothetical protein [Clostridia bacterium]